MFQKIIAQKQKHDTSLSANGATLLTNALWSNDISIAKDLIVKTDKKYLDNPGDIGIYPLALAAYKGFYDVVELLIEKGANLNKPKMNGKSVLFWARKNNHLKIVELLINNHAEIQKDFANFLLKIKDTVLLKKITSIHKNNVSLFLPAALFLNKNFLIFLIESKLISSWQIERLLYSAIKKEDEKIIKNITSNYQESQYRTQRINRIVKSSRNSFIRGLF